MEANIALVEEKEEKKGGVGSGGRCSTQEKAGVCDVGVDAGRYWGRVVLGVKRGIDVDRESWK